MTIAKETVSTNQTSDWTIMVYLNGDNNLSAAQEQILPTEIKNHSHWYNHYR